MTTICGKILEERRVNNTSAGGSEREIGRLWTCTKREAIRPMRTCFNLILGKKSGALSFPTA